MSLRVLTIALLTLLSFLSFPAKAGVIYRWHDITLSPDGVYNEGYIEFDYSVWSLGGEMHETGGNHFYNQPYFGIEKFSFKAWSADGIAANAAFFGLATCEYMRGRDDICNGQPDDYQLSGIGRYDWNFTFGTLLTGNLGLLDGYNEVYMGGDLLWTINYQHSDLNECHYVNCNGGTGLWVLDLTTLPVSEPGTALMIGIALLGLGMRSRRLHSVVHEGRE